MTPIDPRARAGDADREQTVAELQRYTAEGYLTMDEFSDRSAAAYRATTHGELAAITGDLAPRAEPDRHHHASGVIARIPWSPVVIVVAVLVGVVLLAAVVMVVMMLGMMGGMDMGGMR